MSIIRSSQALIELMFGQELAQPSKPDTRTQAIALRLESIEITDGRIQVSLPDLSVATGEVNYPTLIAKR